MQIEFGFQSNCSELVTHLGMVEPDEIITAMKRIVKLTGWNWALKILAAGSESELLLPIPYDKINSLIRIDECRDEKFDRIIEFWSDHIDKKQKKAMVDDEYDDLIFGLELFDGPVDKISIVKWRWGLPVDLSGSESGTPGLTFIISETESKVFPAFHIIRMEFDADLGLYGGNPQYYINWMKFHFKRNKLTKALIGKLTDYNDYPPIDPNQKLTKKALEEIECWSD